MRFYFQRGRGEARASRAHTKDPSQVSSEKRAFLANRPGRLFRACLGSSPLPHAAGRVFPAPAMGGPPSCDRSPFISLRPQPPGDWAPAPCEVDAGRTFAPPAHPPLTTLLPRARTGPQVPAGGMLGVVDFSKCRQLVLRRSRAAREPCAAVSCADAPRPGGVLRARRRRTTREEARGGARPCRSPKVGHLCSRRVGHPAGPVLLPSGGTSEFLTHCRIRTCESLCA